MTSTNTDLFDILDGILSSDHAEQTLASVEDVIRYAEAAGALITDIEARRVIETGKHWLDQRENGDGEWGRMRGEARAELDGDDDASM